MNDITSRFTTPSEMGAANENIQERTLSGLNAAVADTRDGGNTAAVFSQVGRVAKDPEASVQSVKSQLSSQAFRQMEAIADAPGIPTLAKEQAIKNIESRLKQATKALDQSDPQDVALACIKNLVDTSNISDALMKISDVLKMSGTSSQSAPKSPRIGGLGGGISAR